MFDIDFTPEGKEDLKSIRKFEQQEIIDDIQKQLKREPTVETRYRKKLRPNEVCGVGNASRKIPRVLQC